MTPLYEGKYGHSIAVLATFESGKGGSLELFLAGDEGLLERTEVALGALGAARQNNRVNRKCEPNAHIGSYNKRSGRENSSNGTPVQPLPSKKSHLSVPKNPSARALSGLRALLDIERLIPGPHASRHSRPM